MAGGSGDDGVNGGSGNDYLDGEFGNDSIRGGDGNDSISGKEGNDTMRGGYGNDRMDGGSGDDFLSGDFGVDILHGGDGRDTLYEIGGSGNRMYAGELGDKITSAYHPNYSTADDQNFLYGEAGNDKLTGQGRDKLFGGTGNDTLIAKGGNNLLCRGEGLDIFDVRTSHEGVDPLSKKTTIQDFTVEDKIYVGEMVERIFIEQTSSAGFEATRVLGVNSMGTTVPLATLTHGHGYQGEDLFLLMEKLQLYNRGVSHNNQDQSKKS